MKIDRRKKYFMVLDVETTNNHIKEKNSPNDGLVYDLGFGVYDKQGNEYLAKSWVITEIFDNEKELMNSAYYKEKIPAYYEELKKGKRDRFTIRQAKSYITKVMLTFGIKEVYAYNALFDLTTLNNTLRYCTNSQKRFFFPYGTEVCDIWHIACQILGTQKTFQFDNIRNNNGNLITNAERMFAYITGEDFKEEHTGLADVRVEKEILARCLRNHKTIKKGINRSCWRIPQSVA